MIRRIFTLLITALFTLALSQTHAQQAVVGFWEVTEVKVGDQIMTPVAKWIRINDNGIFQSGNGWLQHSEGTWLFDEKYNHFEILDPNAFEDEYGPFSISFEAEKMFWMRMEEGMPVTVTLEPIDKLPKSTADNLVGLWDLIAAEKEGTSIVETYDPEDKRNIFIRWDRIYVEWNAEGNRETGYWHIHGHKPEITLFSHQKGKDAESWEVSFERDNLILQGISDGNKSLKLSFKRVNKFP